MVASRLRHGAGIAMPAAQGDESRTQLSHARGRAFGGPSYAREGCREAAHSAWHIARSTQRVAHRAWHIARSAVRSRLHGGLVILVLGLDRNYAPRHVGQLPAREGGAHLSSGRPAATLPEGRRQCWNLAASR